MRNAQHLVDYVYDTHYTDIAPEVIQRTKDLAMSTLGSAVLGASMDVTKILIDYARKAGGPQEASIYGAGLKTSAEMAAMVNGASAHCTELEDVSFPDAMPTVNIIPAIFALGEKLNLPGKAILEGIVLSFEVAARPALVLNVGEHSLFNHGFQPGPQLAPVGIAGVAAKMMGLSREQALNAMCLATSFACGLVRQTGSGAHVIEPGLAGRNGITAALFAAAGMTAEHSIMQGKSGFWDALGRQPEIDFDLPKGSDFHIMQVGLKRYPCCYFLQRIIDGVVELVQENKLTPDMVENVDVQGNEFFRLMIRQDSPENGEEARFSLHHSVAAALTGDRIFFDTFTTEAVQNPRYRDLWNKTTFTRHPDWTGDAMESDSPVTIRLTNGQEIKRSFRVHKGDPRNPLTQQEVTDRFKMSAEVYLPNKQMDEIAALVYGMDRLNDTTSLANLLTFKS